MIPSSRIDSRPVRHSNNSLGEHHVNVNSQQSNAYLTLGRRERKEIEEDGCVGLLKLMSDSPTFSYEKFSGRR